MGEERLGYSAAEIQIGVLVAGELIVPEKGFWGGVSQFATHRLGKTHRVQTPNVRVLGLTACEFRWLRAVPAAEMPKAPMTENRKP